MKTKATEQGIVSTAHESRFAVVRTARPVHAARTPRSIRRPGHMRVGRLASCALAAMLALAGVAAAAGTLVDLNSATLEQLEELPGIGKAKAEAIIEERTKSKFTSVDDLERVKGIGPAAMADLRERVTVSSAAAK